MCHKENILKIIIAIGIVLVVMAGILSVLEMRSRKAVPAEEPMGEMTIIQPPIEESTDFIVYSTEANTDLEKLEFAYRANELLRLEYNAKAKKAREGEIAWEVWVNYRDNEFWPKSLLIGAECARLRNPTMAKLLGVEKIDFDNATQTDFILQKKTEFKNSTKWRVDLDNIVTPKQLKTLK